MAERKREIQIKFYMTEQERILIEEKMKLLATSNLGAYLRKMAIDGYIIQVDYSAIKEQTAEIQKIGVNINQIAKCINSTGNAYEQDIKEIRLAGMPEYMIHLNGDKFLGPRWEKGI